MRKEEFRDKYSDIVADYSSLKRLKVQVGQDCNIHCTMCYQNKDKQNNHSIDIERLKEQVDFSPFEKVDIQGGEPMFIRSGRDLFEYSASLGKKVSFVTNGTVMNQTWAEKIALNSSIFHVSLNAATKETHEMINSGSSWEKVLRNIQMVREARERLDGEVEIKGHFTIIRKNCREVPLFIERFRGLGFDTIDFGYDFRFPYYLAIHPLLFQRLKSSVSGAYKNSQYKDSIDSLRLSSLKLI